MRHMKTQAASKKLLNIRKEKRADHLSRARNTMRFQGEVEFLKNEEKDQYDIRPIDMSLGELKEAISDENTDLLCEAITNVDLDLLEKLEECSADILEVLSKRLVNPKAILAVGNFANHSTIFSSMVFQMDKFSSIVGYLERLQTGSKQQGVYLWAICQLTQRPEVVDVSQLAGLYRVLQELFQIKTAEGKEDNMLIRLLKNVGECGGGGLSDTLLIQLCDFFWKANNLVNQINLYVLACSRICVPCKSTSLLVRLLTVIIRGRNKLPVKIDYNLNPRNELLLKCFKNYNEVWEILSETCQIHIGQTQINVGLHQYLLQFHQEVFSEIQPKECSKEIHYQFLLQFCKNGPAEEICIAWHNMGTLEWLIKNMDHSPDLCYMTLQLIHTLIKKSSSMSKSHVLELLQTHNLEDHAISVMELFSEKSITSLGTKVLEQLQCA